jgi:hypothetical protein
MKFNKVQTIILISILSTLSIVLVGGRFFLAYLETGHELLFRYLPAYDPIQAYKYFYKGNGEFHESLKETIAKTDQMNHINTAIESYIRSYSLLHREETLRNLEAAKRRKKQLEEINDQKKSSEEAWNESKWGHSEKIGEQNKKDESMNNGQQKKNADTSHDGNNIDEWKKWEEKWPENTSPKRSPKWRTGFTNSGMLQQIGDGKSLTWSGMKLLPEDRNALLDKKKELENLQTEKNTYIRPDGKIEVNSDLWQMFEQFFGRNIIQPPKNEDPEDY